MLLEYIEHIRGLPVAERKKRALAISAGATGIILIAWLSVLYFGTNTYINNNTGPDSSASRSFDDLTPANTSVFSDAAAQFRNLMQAASTEPYQENVPTQMEVESSPQNDTMNGTGLTGTAGEAPANTAPAASGLPIDSAESANTPQGQDALFVEDILRDIDP